MTISVIGTPAPQGSKKHVGRGIMIESSKQVRPWREAVVWAARGHASSFLSGPVNVAITFYLAKPKSAPKSVTVPFRKPDIDKLCRSTLDALVTAGAIEDDARVVSLNASKEFAGPGGLDVPGAIITIGSHV